MAENEASDTVNANADESLRADLRKAMAFSFLRVGAHMRTRKPFLGC